MGILGRDAKVLVRWPTQQTLGLDEALNVYASDRDGGSINYDNGPLNGAPIEAWPPEFLGGKIGDGLGPDGEGADGFGYGGFGDGVGADGLGPDGFGALLQEYVTAAMLDRIYKFAVVPVDAAGNENRTAAIEVDVAVAGVPRPPARPEAADYDLPTEALSVRWDMSLDDEAA